MEYFRSEFVEFLHTVLSDSGSV